MSSEVGLVSFAALFNDDDIDFDINFDFDLPLFGLGDYKESSSALSEDEESVKGEDKTEKLYKTFTVCVLANCIDELALLRNCYASYAASVTIKKLPYESLEERCNKIIQPKEYKVATEYTDMEKLQKEVGILLFLLHTFLKEAGKYGTCFAFTQCIENLIKMHKEEIEFASYLKRKRKTYNHLRYTLLKQKRRTSSLKDVHNTFQAFFESMEKALTEVNYIKKWEDCRVEQNKLILNLKEDKLKTTFTRMIKNIENEKQCHLMIENFLTETKDDFMNQIENWMETYENDLEAKEANIFQLNVEIEKINQKFEKLKTEYEKRESAIEAYVEYKKIKKAQAEFLELQHKAATKIQAWWRGCMVRRFLGPYKKTKKKTKKNAVTKKSKR